MSKKGKKTDDENAFSSGAGAPMSPEDEALLAEMLDEEEPKKALPPTPPPEPEEQFGKEAISALLQGAGARYPLQRAALLSFLAGKRVRFWRDFPAIPLDELIGLSRCGIFHSEEEVLAVADTHLKNKPAGAIFSTQHGRS